MIKKNKDKICRVLSDIEKNEDYFIYCIPAVYELNLDAHYRASAILKVSKKSNETSAMVEVIKNRYGRK